MIDGCDDIAFGGEVFGEPRHANGRVAISMGNDHEGTARAFRFGILDREAGNGEGGGGAGRLTAKFRAIGDGLGAF
jgi:hypothetical protein